MAGVFRCLIGVVLAVSLAFAQTSASSSSKNKNAPELEALSWIIGKCAEKNVGLVEALQALETTAKCVEALEPGYLKIMKSEPAEDRVDRKKEIAEEVCKTWQETNHCLKPLSKVAERCFDRKKGVMQKGLDIFHRELCQNRAEANTALIELGFRMVETWETCVKSKQKTLSTKLESCMAENGGIQDYICRDYQGAVNCITQNLDEVCEEANLGYAIGRVLKNRKVSNYVSKKLFQCPSLKTEL